MEPRIIVWIISTQSTYAINSIYFLFRFDWYSYLPKCVVAAIYIIDFSRRDATRYFKIQSFQIAPLSSHNSICFTLVSSYITNVIYKILLHLENCIS